MIRASCSCNFYTTERCISTLFDRYPSGIVYEDSDGDIFAEMQCPVCPETIVLDASEADLIDYLAKNGEK